MDTPLPFHRTLSLCSTALTNRAPDYLRYRLAMPSIWYDDPSDASDEVLFRPPSPPPPPVAQPPPKEPSEDPPDVREEPTEQPTEERAKKRHTGRTTRRITRSYAKTHSTQHRSKHRKSSPSPTREEPPPPSRDPSPPLIVQVDSPPPPPMEEVPPPPRRRRDLYVPDVDRVLAEIETYTTLLTTRAIKEPPLVDVTVSRTFVPMTAPVLDLRTEEQLLTFRDVPEVLQPKPVPPPVVPSRRPAFRYRFPGSDAGFNTVDQYRILRLNADLRELDQVDVLLAEIDRTLALEK